MATRAKYHVVAKRKDGLYDPPIAAVDDLEEAKRDAKKLKHHGPRWIMNVGSIQIHRAGRSLLRIRDGELHRGAPRTPWVQER
jgi:hypothetical protein